MLVINEILRILSLFILTGFFAGWLSSVPPTPPVSTIPGRMEHRSSPIPLRLPAWHRDPEISWYGPGFYGHRTACGIPLTHELVGVAHRTLPCGTLIEFRWKGTAIVVPVVDRGPYVQGRVFDLTGAACTALQHCFTGPIEWRRISGNGY